MVLPAMQIAVFQLVLIHVYTYNNIMLFKLLADLVTPLMRPPWPRANPFSTNFFRAANLMVWYISINSEFLSLGPGSITVGNSIILLQYLSTELPRSSSLIELSIYLE